MVYNVNNFLFATFLHDLAYAHGRGFHPPCPPTGSYFRCRGNRMWSPELLPSAWQTDGTIRLFPATQSQKPEKELGLSTKGWASMFNCHVQNVPSVLILTKLFAFCDPTMVKPCTGCVCPPADNGLFKHGMGLFDRISQRTIWLE